jgi:acyl-coenzyme A synthetase/AMP-(fatty) acid ligase
MDNIFFIDENVITYAQLISELNEPNTICNLSEIEKSIINVIRGLISDTIIDYNHLIENIKTTNSIIQLKTSGTTAEPKTINHTFESMTRNIKVSNNI